MKIIKFKTIDFLFSFLKNKNIVLINRFENLIHFNKIDYKKEDFIKYLEENEIITLVYTYNYSYDFELKFNKSLEFLEEIQLNETYLNSILNDSNYSKHNRYLVSLNEVAKILDVTRQTVINYINDSQLETYKIGTSVKLKYNDVIKFIEKRKAKK